MKHGVLIAITMLIALSASAQKYISHIEGTASDPDTREICLFEAGTKTTDNESMFSIPVADGKFCYDLKSDELRHYVLVPKEQLMMGYFNKVEIISENQNVNIRMYDITRKPVVKADGKETMMIGQCQKYLHEKFDALSDSLSAQSDSLEAILDEETKWCSSGERDDYYLDLRSRESGNPHAVAYQRIGKETEQLSQAWEESKCQWLEEHTCFFGLSNLWVHLTHRSNQQVVYPFYKTSYKTRYRKKYSRHPYHKDIKRSIKSDL